MKSNLEYEWRITLINPDHRISANKTCTFEQALIVVEELETEVDWLVTAVFISRRP